MLKPNTEVAFKVDNYYDLDYDGVVRWNSPRLAIDWGVPDEYVIL